MLDKTTNQPSKFRTKNWVKRRGTYKTDSQIQFNTRMLKSSLCDCIDAYIVVKAIITVFIQGIDGEVMVLDRKNK